VYVLLNLDTPPATEHGTMENTKSALIHKPDTWTVIKLYILWYKWTTWIKNLHHLMFFCRKEALKMIRTLNSPKEETEARIEKAWSAQNKKIWNLRGAISRVWFHEPGRCLVGQ
jgi:hypothetical protein